MKNYHFRVLLFGLSSLLFYTACEHQEHHHDLGTYQATQPVRKDTTTLKEYVCQIRSHQHIELRALERGYLQDIYVDEGKRVKKGQLMFRIMPLVYQAEVQKAEAEAKFVEVEYLNTKQLAEQNIVSQSELALAKAKLEKAKAELALAKTHLNFTEIRAPFDGIMGRFNVRLGSLVEEGELLTTLSDNSKVWVYFNVPEAEYLDFFGANQKNNLPKVQLQMANRQLFDQLGTIETIEADFNNETGNIAFRATFANPQGLLRHGETGNILMPVALKNVLLIPQKATFEILGKKYVFVIGANNMVTMREITVSGEMPHLFVVANGLQDNEKILIEGLRKVKNGDVVKYTLVPMSRILAELNRLHAE
ncbi:MAG: efflux RND transporter periplasmic adaptor subunit [Cytophagales bacterium]|nr:efflux RND transporter periplasmic adaptor subunit [Bernardetiaceae bacterium]MDW8204349.1 efflux RND transporter periplasmic adaptor subunit [Cytophagales bacterium]